MTLILYLTQKDEIPLLSSLNTGPYSFSHLLRRNTHDYEGSIDIIYKSFMYLQIKRKLSTFVRNALCEIIYYVYP